nr:hypothetical protein [Tanacetum cinerariifolium]
MARNSTGVEKMEKEDPAVVTKSLVKNYNEFIDKLSSQSSIHANVEANSYIEESIVKPVAVHATNNDDNISEDGLSLIGTQIGKPVMLDAFTSSICIEPWGRMGFARALIEVEADKNLKEEIIMAVPRLEEEGHNIERIRVKYEWKPPRLVKGQALLLMSFLMFSIASWNIQGNDQKERRVLWNDLGFHNTLVHGMPWILLGDFNVTLNMEDSLTSSSSMTSSMCEFKDCVEHIEVLDICSSGLQFTWNQKPKANQWSTQVNGCYMYQVVQKMKLLKKPLCKLLHEHGNFHERVTKLRVELDAIQIALDKDPYSDTLREEEAVYLMAFNEAKVDEEPFLKQKAKVDWLEVGDSNSAYFHKTIKGHNQRSRIEVIRTADNVELTGPCVPNCFVEHYKEFLGTDDPCIELDSTDLFMKHVSDMSCAHMTRPVTNEEVKKAMFDIGDDKSPGPDGFSSVFFKEGWDTIGNDVCNAVRDFFLKWRISDNSLITQELMRNYHRNSGPPRLWLVLPQIPFPLVLTRTFMVLTLIIQKRGYSLNSCVADLVTNGVWNWPQAWLAKAPDIGSIAAHNITERQDCLQWCDANGTKSRFSVKCAWEALRLGVWRFPGTILFGLLILSLVWDYVRVLADLDNVPPILMDIVATLQAMGKARTARSILGRLILAATTYFIWNERNNRLFNKINRRPEDIRDMIMVTVRLKILTFKFTSNVTRLLQ